MLLAHSKTKKIDDEMGEEEIKKYEVQKGASLHSPNLLTLTRLSSPAPATSLGGG